jgi:2-polyprenyl-6-methoxyphenol hydroxylase-like FAD-dependent oxidoreductase
VIGLSTAMLLADEGHEVTVLEADPAPVPDDPAHAWERWDRRGVAQFHQPHNLFARARQVMDEDLPGLTDALLDAGGIPIDPMATLPPTISEFSRGADDDRFRFVNARRPTMEAVIAQAADRHAGVTVRRGVRVGGLRVNGGTGGVPHVDGLLLENGEDVDADLVVDAMGRRTKLPDWLSAAGAAAPHVESQDSGFVYYTRYFRGEQPVALAAPLSAIGCFSLLTLRSDNGTWSVTVFTGSDDTELRRLRDPERFIRVVQGCPLHAQWLDGEPIGDIEVMAGVVDRYRRYLVDDRPIVTGVVPVGDAWACTNPSAGRGISVGLVHAQALRDSVRGGVDDPDALVRRFDATSRGRVEPFYREQLANDRRRLAEMAALARGETPEAPDPLVAAAGAAMARDATVFRGMIEVVQCLAFASDVFRRPEVQEHVAPFVGQAPTPLPGPDREALVACLS